MTEVIQVTEQGPTYHPGDWVLTPKGPATVTTAQPTRDSAWSPVVGFWYEVLYVGGGTESHYEWIGSLPLPWVRWTPQTQPLLCSCPKPLDSKDI